MQSPCDHFARHGYAYLSARIPDDHPEPWPDDEAEDDCPGSQADWEQRAVLAMIRGERPAKSPKKGPKPKEPEEGEAPRERPLDLAGVRIHWPNSLPQLAVWRGATSTLESIIAKRQAACWAAELPFGVGLIDWRLPLPTQSGIDPRSCVNAIDAGFSPNVAGMDIIAYPAAELLAVVGMEVTPITRIGYEHYAYRDPLGSEWQVRIEERAGTHYRRLSYATPVTIGVGSSIREMIARRAADLGLTPHAIAAECGPGENGEPILRRDHVAKYLAGEKDMATAKVDAVLRVLGMRVVVMTTSAVKRGRGRPRTKPIPEGPTNPVGRPRASAAGAKVKVECW